MTDGAPALNGSSVSQALLWQPVGREGFEPSWTEVQRILSPQRLPFRHRPANYKKADSLRLPTISPLKPPHLLLEATAGLEPAMGVLQTPALPLGDVALKERKTGFEPAALCLASRCSTTEPLPLGQCRGPELNWGHHDFQSCALPTELPRRASILYHLPHLVNCVGLPTPRPHLDSLGTQRTRAWRAQSADRPTVTLLRSSFHRDQQACTASGGLERTRPGRNASVLL